MIFKFPARERCLFKTSVSVKTLSTCLTKSNLSGGLHKTPSNIGLDLGKKNVNENTVGIAAIRYPVVLAQI